MSAMRDEWEKAMEQARFDVAESVRLLNTLRASMIRDYWIVENVADFADELRKAIGPAASAELVWCLCDWLTKYHPKFEEVRDIVNIFTSMSGSETELPKEEGHAWQGRKNLPPMWNDGDRRGESIVDWKASEEVANG